MTPRVLYMAYGDIGRFCLAELQAGGFDIVGVFCRSSDRTERDDIPSVYTAARRAGLHVFAATDPNEPVFLDEARRLAPDLLLSVQYDRILKRPLLTIPRYGSYNLHFGPLPRLRGCFPTKWAIIEDAPAGVAFHCIDPGIDTHRFPELSRFVAKASQRPVSPWKPIVGERVFSHESGLHADGVIKNPRNYEGFDPADVGLKRYFVLGKHSGTSGLVERYRDMGIAVSRKEAVCLLEQVRAIAQRVKRPLNEKELVRLHRKWGLKAA